MAADIKFRKITEELREMLRRPGWRVGALLESEHQLMERFQVSRRTVREALQMLVDEGLIARHHGKGSVLVRKPTDESKLRRGIHLGLIGNRQILDANQSDFGALGNAIVEEAQRWGANLSLFPCLSPEEPTGAGYLRELLSSNLADGFFLSLMPDLRESVDFLDGEKIPNVLLFPSLLPTAGTEWCANRPGVIPDELGPLTALCRRLAADGVTQVVLPCARIDLLPSRTCDLCRAATAAAGLEFESFPFETPGFAETVALLKRIRGARTLLVLSNHFVERFDFALDSLGWHVPDDLRVLLFRHYTPDWSAWLARYPVLLRDENRLGALAAERMHRLILHKECGSPLAADDLSLTVLPARVAGRTDLLGTTKSNGGNG